MGPSVRWQWAREWICGPKSGTHVPEKKVLISNWTVRFLVLASELWACSIFSCPRSFAQLFKPYFWISQGYFRSVFYGNSCFHSRSTTCHRPPPYPLWPTEEREKQGVSNSEGTQKNVAVQDPIFKVGNRRKISLFGKKHFLWCRPSIRWPESRDPQTAIGGGDFVVVVTFVADVGARFAHMYFFRKKYVGICGLLEI